MTRRNPRVKALKDEFEQVQAPRRRFERVWVDVDNLILPRTPGGDTNLLRPRIYDNTAVFANEMLAATLAGQLISPTSRWLILRFHFDDEGYNVQKDEREWLDKVRDIVLAELNSSRSQFHLEAHSLFLDLAGLGTSAMFVGETPRGVNFSTRAMPEIYARENSDGVVDTTFRQWDWTARQAIQHYGKDRLPQKIVDKAASKPDEMFNFLQVISPREERDPRGKLSIDKPWASIHICTQPEAVVMESGFDEFPMMVPRWEKLAGEVYGRSPAMTALPDVRMLQKMSEVQIKAAQLATWPPMLIPDDGMIGPMKAVPGGLNFYRATSKNKPEPLETAARPDIGLDMMDQRREAVLRAFFFDMMQLRENPEMTATQVLAQREERFRRMQPMLTRIQVEFLAPLIERTINILARQGRLPEPPRDLEGAGFEIEFTSPAVLAQNVAEANNMTRFFSAIGPVLEVDPASAANIDADAYIRDVARKFNVPASIIASKQHVQDMRESQNTNAELSAGTEQAKTGSEALKNIADIQDNGGQRTA